MGNNNSKMPEEEGKVVKKPFKGAQVLWPADMPDNILEDAIMISKKAMDENDFETAGVDIARIVKEHMDKNWEPSWHVFLGKSFGAQAVYEKNRFVYFTFDASKISFL